MGGCEGYDYGIRGYGFFLEFEGRRVFKETEFRVVEMVMSLFEEGRL